MFFDRGSECTAEIHWGTISCITQPGTHGMVKSAGCRGNCLMLNGLTVGFPFCLVSRIWPCRHLVPMSHPGVTFCQCPVQLPVIVPQDLRSNCKSVPGPAKALSVWSSLTPLDAYLLNQKILLCIIGSPPRPWRPRPQAPARFLFCTNLRGLLRGPQIASLHCQADLASLPPRASRRVTNVRC